jgi:histidinol-phosphate aminotransferase
MIDLEKLVRENIRSLVPYSSARDEYTGDSGVFLDANENPYGNLNRYPDPYQRKLKKEISRLKNVPEENIFLGNGSDEAIDLIYRIFCIPSADKALTFTPTYGMYEVCASINDIELVKIPMDEEFRINVGDAEKYLPDAKLKIIIICSPNNPSGNSAALADIEYLLSNFKGIVVIDEAYIDFSSKPSFISLLGKFNNLIVLQTFSKAWGMAAVRVGMAFADSRIISWFNKVKPPYNISGINQDAVLGTIKDKSNFNRNLAMILEERRKLTDNLGKMKIVTRIYPTDANFVLVRVKDADRVYDELLKERIIIRNRTKVINNCLRITVGTPEENERLIVSMNKIEL